MSRENQLEKLLESIYDGAREGQRTELPPAEYERRRHDFVFHMLDWKDDLEQLARCYRDPNGHDEESASALVIGFLVHVLPHLSEAGRLLLDGVENPFADDANSSSAVPTVAVRT